MFGVVHEVCARQARVNISIYNSYERHVIYLSNQLKLNYI